MEISITIPTTWAEMTAPQLCYVARLMAGGFTTLSIKSWIVLRTVPQEYVRRVRPDHLAVAASRLGFLDTAPAAPVRPPRLGGGAAIGAELHGTPLAHWLEMENLWHAVLEGIPAGTPDREAYALAAECPAMRPLLERLWPGYKARAVRPWHAVLAFLWMTGLKSLFAATFPFLYKPAAEGADDTPADMRGRMETQIRALTGGDITKRQAVIESDTWAALYELNEKAREAEELARKAH